MANAPLALAVSYLGDALESFMSNKAMVAPFIDCLLEVSETLPLTEPMTPCCAITCREIIIKHNEEIRMRRNNFFINSCISLKMIRRHCAGKLAEMLNFL